jgi:uncharacterized protein YndB with AHSA1/START domain
MDINRNAPVITRDAIVIAAPLSTVWKVLTDIAAWPEWQQDINRASLEGPLATGTVFHWSTAGLDIASTIGALVPQERIAWSGHAQGIMDVHVWRLTPLSNGVRVQTEGSWDGEGVQRERDRMQQALDRSIHSWLERLKLAAETQK